MKDKLTFLPILSFATLILGTAMAVFFAFAYWYIVNISQSSLYASYANISTDIIILLCLPFLGKLTDFYSKKHILFFLYLLGFLISIFALLLVIFEGFINGLKSVIFIIFLVNLFTLIRTSDQLARTAYFKVKSNKVAYQKGNRILEGIRQGITFISGGCAMLVINHNTNLITIFSFLGAMFLFSMVIVIFLPVDLKDRKLDVNHVAVKPKVKFIKQIKRQFYEFNEGFLILKSKLNQFDLTILIISIFPYTFVVSLNVTYPAYFNLLSNNPIYYAALTIPYGLGALSASVFERKTNINFYFVFLKYSIIFLILLFIGFLYQSLISTYLILFGLAYAHASIRIHRNTHLMNLISSEEIGRVLSFFEVIFTLGVIIFSLILGYVSDLYLASTSWAVLCILYLFILLSMCFFYRRSFFVNN